jgi:purine nucleosidase
LDVDQQAQTCLEYAKGGSLTRRLRPFEVLPVPSFPLLIDTDPGVDDAWAILMAATRSDCELVALTVVGGNVGLSATCTNACRLVDLLGLRIPVYPGAAAPLIGGVGDATHVHGADGFGDVDLPLPSHPLQSVVAAQAIIDQARRHAGTLEILALGPLTNLALALRLEPALPEMIAGLTVMGGALDGIGNLTPQAEFNFAFDPEAAEIVLRDWNRLVLVDWAMTLALAPPVDAVERMLQADTAKARLMHRITRQIRGYLDRCDADRWALADPLAAHVLLDGRQWPRQQHAVRVLLDQGPERGASRIEACQPGRASVWIPDLAQHNYMAALEGALT